MFYVFMVRNWFKTIVMNSIFVGVPGFERTEENIKDFFSQGKKQEKFRKKVFCGAKESYCLYKKALIDRNPERRVLFSFLSISFSF